jgi:hypothetical protein
MVDKKNSGAKFPKVSFSTFINSIAASAFVHLGMIKDPMSGQVSKNITAAKQTIDILGMFEEKTKNNLNQEEENLLKNLLHDLRLNYVKADK